MELAFFGNGLSKKILRILACAWTLVAAFAVFNWLALSFHTHPMADDFN